MSTLSEYTIAVSTEEASTMVRSRTVSKSRCRTVENAIPDAPRASHNVLRRELGLSQEARIIGAVGRITYQKDPSLFVTIAHEMVRRDMGVDLHFVWIGEGDDRATIEGMLDKLALRQRVHFIGERADVESLLGDLNILLMTSWYEGLSYALLEGIRSGLPIVTTAVEGTRSVLGQAGIIVDSRDPREFADVLERLLADPSTLAALGSRSRELYAERYHMSRMAEQLSEIYHECAQRRRMRALQSHRSSA